MIRTRTIILCAILAVLANIANAWAGEIIPKDKLPASIAAPKKVKAEPKFPGIPACSKGRLKLEGKAACDKEPMSTWAAEHPKHECLGATAIYVCVAFGKLSVRCATLDK